MAIPLLLISLDHTFITCETSKHPHSFRLLKVKNMPRVRHLLLQWHRDRWPGQLPCDIPPPQCNDHAYILSMPAESAHFKRWRGVASRKKCLTATISLTPAAAFSKGPPAMHWPFPYRASLLTSSAWSRAHRIAEPSLFSLHGMRSSESVPAFKKLLSSALPHTCAASLHHSSPNNTVWWDYEWASLWIWYAAWNVSRICLLWMEHVPEMKERHLNRSDRNHSILGTDKDSILREQSHYKNCRISRTQEWRKAKRHSKLSRSQMFLSCSPKISFEKSTFRSTAWWKDAHASLAQSCWNPF